LHDAINATLTAPNVSLVVTTSPGPLGVGTSVNKVVIEKPDRISISGGPNVIAIGSTGYFKVQPGWTVVHHVGESMNFTNDMLIYIDILKRATSATHEGDTYNVPPAEAAHLLVTTGLTRFRGASDVSLSATIAGGLVKSVSLHVGGASPISALTTVDEIGSSPAVEALHKIRSFPGKSWPMGRLLWRWPPWSWALPAVVRRERQLEL